MSAETGTPLPPFDDRRQFLAFVALTVGLVLFGCVVLAVLAHVTR